MRSSNHWSLLLPSSNWKLGAAVLGLASIAGGFAVNAYLNPPTTSSTVSGPTTEPDKTVTSDQIPYQYGYVELKVTKSAGKLSAIDVGGSTATDGREQAYPLLVDEAIKAQGSSFGNLGGATYTTDAFKKALDNAIAKLG
jgi:uncharacterized protein with FMN-binding domain